MKRQHTYESLIAQKLNRATAPNIERLWSGMETILNKEMPQRPEKKRRFGPWWFSANVLFAAGLTATLGSAYTWTRLRTTELTSSISSPAQSNAVSSVSSKTQVTVQSFAEPTANAAIENKAVLTENKDAENFNSIKQNNRKAENTFGYRNKAAGLPAPPQVDRATENAYTDSNGEVIGPADNKQLAEVDRLVANSTPALKLPANPLTTADAKQKIGLKRRLPIHVDKGLSLGLVLSHPVAVGSQQKADLDMQGRKNQWQDYIPSVYAQYHFSKKLYAQVEWSPVAAQYTPNFVLYDKVEQSNPDEKEESRVKLDKLFYTNFPLSLHYNLPWKGLTVGTGVQYSLLKKILLRDQQYYHLIGPGYWNTEERKNATVAKDPANDGHAASNTLDEVAGAFRRSDWRLLADVGYNRKGLTAGLRFTKGLQPYINSNFTNLPVKDRNEALQVYLRYSIFDGRKK